ncbi:MAG TPA: aminotransferase class V-fold PLP-dependent enzyme [Rhabdochlamydiaceae bacterium]|jgi:cysteine desulfurase
MSSGVLFDNHVLDQRREGDADSKIERCCAQILHSLGGEETRTFHFCSSGAEAINCAFFSHYFDSVRLSGQNQFLTSQVESAPFLCSMQRMEESGCCAKFISPNAQGQITREILLKALKARTGFLSLSWAQGLTGVIHPIADLAESCKERNIALHVDISHILGKIYFRLDDLPIDFLTFDGQLADAPQGTGGLILRKGASFTPLIAGKASPSLSLLSALSTALASHADLCDHYCLEIARLRDKLEQGIKSAIADAVIFFERAERLPHCTAIGFPGVSAEALLYLLQRNKVYATIGGGTEQRLSHVLIASGVPSLLAESAVSFSLSSKTTEEEIDCALKVIVASVKQLKNCSSQILRELL